MASASPLETPGAGMGALRFRSAAPASAEAVSPTLSAHAVAFHVLYDYADLRSPAPPPWASRPAPTVQTASTALTAVRSVTTTGTF